MRHRDVFINGLGVATTATESTVEGGYAWYADGVIGAPARPGQPSIARATGPAYASAAAREAMLDAGRHHAFHGRGPWMPPVDLHLHATVLGSGLGAGRDAAMVRECLGAPGPGLSAQLSGMSQCMLGGIDLAAGILQGRVDVSVVAVTGGDALSEPIGAWNASTGLGYEPGGAAVILTRRRGWASVLASASWAEPHRDASRANVAAERRTVSPGICADSVVPPVPEPADVRAREALRQAVAVDYVCRTVLRQAKVAAHRVHVLGPPGYAFPGEEGLRALGLAREPTPMRQGVHVGVSDPLVALHTALTDGVVARGDWVLLLSTGLGAGAVACLVQVLG